MAKITKMTEIMVCDTDGCGDEAYDHYMCDTCGTDSCYSHHVSVVVSGKAVVDDEKRGHALGGARGAHIVLCISCAKKQLNIPIAWKEEEGWLKRLRL